MAHCSMHCSHHLRCTLQAGILVQRYVIVGSPTQEAELARVSVGSDPSKPLVSYLLEKHDAVTYQ